MAMKNWQDVWQRLCSGHHVVLRRAERIPPPDLGLLRLASVDCAAFPEPRGTLEEARRQIDAQLETSPIIDAGARRLRAGLRRHLLGEDPEQIDVSRYEDAFARVVGAAERPMALLLRGVDRADPQSIEMLVRLFAGQHKPKWPLLISFERRHPSGAARLLLEQLERVLPANAFWHEAGIADGGSAAVSELLTRTSSGTLRILRAAAAMGDRFEIEVVGHLLGLDELTVLDAVQEALDLGLSLEDRGQGVFRFDPSVAAALREQTLPALTRAWRERLAERFGGTPAPGEAVDAEPSAAPGATALANRASELAWPESAPPGSLAQAPSTGSAANPPPTDSPVTPQEARECFEVPAGLAALPGDPRTDAWWQRLNAAAMNAVADGAAHGGERAAASAEPRPMGPSGAAPSGVARPEPKAAESFGAAELRDSRCERELAAAERLALLGQHEQALASSARALALADAVDDRERQRVLRARALLMIGQSRWQYRGPAAASLELALEPLAQARELVSSDEPPELSAQIAAMIANVCYDLGTPEALERALVELTRASQVLLAAERPLDAARLLNDEAALWVKIGDPARAHYLLARSREIFGKAANCCPAAQSELLETEHLLARLVLHASARPGREREAVRLAIPHALAAEQGYRELEDQRQLGRVWETLGRLELRLGRLDEAAQRLEDAQRLQRQIGDGIGLARSSGAMSEVFIEARDYPRALSNLAESIAVNSEKGSGAGLQFNLASLRKLEQQLPDGLLPEAHALGQRLVSALSVS
jgi:tetratricopeptide (TPR) repeat protein